MLPSDEEREASIKAQMDYYLVSAIEVRAQFAFVVGAEVCPTCRADLGTPCRNSITGGDMFAPHPRRVRAASTRGVRS